MERVVTCTIRILYISLHGTISNNSISVDKTAYWTFNRLVSLQCVCHCRFIQIKLCLQNLHSFWTRAEQLPQITHHILKYSKHIFISWHCSRSGWTRIVAITCDETEDYKNDKQDTN